MSEDDEGPNKLLESVVLTIEVAKAHLGVLILETDQGRIPVCINRSVAAELIAELALFMAAVEVDDLSALSEDGVN